MLGCGLVKIRDDAGVKYLEVAWFVLEVTDGDDSEEDEGGFVFNLMFCEKGMMIMKN